MIDENKLVQIRQMINAAEEAIHSAKKLLTEETESEVMEEPIDFSERAKMLGKESSGGRIIEGVFDGLNMVGPNGKQYNVPANYASKSKLVEGDILKLTIADDGSFVYKQIGPVERKRIIGTLVQDEQLGEYRVLSNGKSYRVLLASITYFKGEVGDEVVILIPKDKQSAWAAVENVVKGGAMIQEAAKEKPSEKEKNELTKEKSTEKVEKPKLEDIDPLIEKNKN